MTKSPFQGLGTDNQEWSSTLDRMSSKIPLLLDRLSAGSNVWNDKFSGIDFSRHSRFESLRDLPFTTKDELRTFQADATPGQPLGSLQVAQTGDLVQVISSSGTTGTPVFFGLTHNDWSSWKRLIGNGFHTAGVSTGSMTALTTGMPMVAGGIAYADGIREAGGSLAWVGGQTMPRMAMMVQNLGVNVLVGTASFATFFAEKCEAELGRSATELSVRTIIGGGEPGLGVAEIRARVADAWGATRVSEIMGLGDVLPLLWAECSVGNGMHFTAAPDVLVELIEPETGERIPWEPGAQGEAVYTTLTREASPVLRFRSRDHMEIMSVSCACGRQTPTVRCVGRTDDMLIYKAMNVYPSAIRDIAMSVGGDAVTGLMRIRKDDLSQVRFDAPIPLEIEIKDSLSDSEKLKVSDDIAEAIRQQLRVRVAPETLKPGTIPVGAYKNALSYVRD
jgi:phenylacetate-coenzyme A ligase PaaK-like adenylate-forming protein